MYFFPLKYFTFSVSKIYYKQQKISSLPQTNISQNMYIRTFHLLNINMSVTSWLDYLPLRTNPYSSCDIYSLPQRVLVALASARKVLLYFVITTTCCSRILTELQHEFLVVAFSS